MATKEEDEAAAKVVAEKGAEDAAKDKGPTPEERAAADQRRTEEATAAKAKIDEQEQRIAKLDEKIKELRDKQAADAKRGKDTQELEARIADQERRLVDQEKTMIDLHQREKDAIERANSKTLETDLRSALTGRLIDSDAITAAIDLLILRKKARVDSDGKVAIVDEKGNWGSLTPDAVLKHVPTALQAAKGVPGSGGHGPAGEAISTDLKSRVFGSQAEFNKAQDEGKISTGDGRRVKAQ